MRGGSSKTLGQELEYKCQRLKTKVCLDGKH